MARCWAHMLGGCEAMSGEHVFSNAVFKPGCGCPRVIEGVRRIRGGAPTHNAEKANILCRRHNSILSPLDALAGRVATFQAQANDEAFREDLFVEGELLERWALKTAVNVGAAGWAGQRKWLPSRPVVEAIFGLAPVPPWVGLYSVDGVDPYHRPSGGMSFTPIVVQRPGGSLLAGAYLAMHGMPLFVAFDDSIVARIEEGELQQALPHFSESGPRHLYHPGAIVMSRQRGGPVIVGISWKGLLRYADGSTAPFPNPGEP